MNNSIKQLREQMGLSQADLGSSVTLVDKQLIQLKMVNLTRVCHWHLSWVNFLTLLLNKFFQQITLINRINYGKS